MPSLVELFVDEANEHQLNLERFSITARREILGELKVLEENLENWLNRISPGDVQRQSARFQRQEKLLRRIQKVINSGFRDVNRISKKTMRDLAQVSQEVAVERFNEIFKTKIFQSHLGRTALNKLADDALITGGPMREWWGKQAQNLRFQFANEIRLGILQGERTEDLIRRIRGKATGRRQTLIIKGKKVIVPEFTGGIMQITTRHADALVRTAVQTINNAVRYELFLKNGDIIQAGQLLAVLDDRTTMICLSRSGAVWDLKTGEPLENTAEGFPGPPPYHFRCRSTLIPIMKMAEQLGFRNRRFGKISKEVRDSMDGKTTKVLTTEQWLRTKNKTKQLEVLGPRRWELWNEGKIKLNRLLDDAGRPLTVEQLAAQ
jgi:hypothetical protein